MEYYTRIPILFTSLLEPCYFRFLGYFELEELKLVVEVCDFNVDL